MSFLNAPYFIESRFLSCGGRNKFEDHHNPNINHSQTCLVNNLFSRSTWRGCTSSSCTSFPSPFWLFSIFSSTKRSNGPHKFVQVSPGEDKDHVYRMAIVEGRCTMARSSSFRSKLFIGWHKSIVSSDWSDTMVWFGQILLLLYFYHPIYMILGDHTRWCYERCSW